MSESLKVALVTSCRNDPNAGVACATISLAAAMRAAGVSVDVFFFEDLMPLFLSRNGGRKFLPLFPAFLAANPRWKDYDVVDAASNELWLLSIRHRLFTKRHRPLFVSRSHGLDHVMDAQLRARAARREIKLSWKYPLYNGGYRLWEVSQSMRCADLCLVLNDGDKHYAIEKIRIPASKLHVMDNGIDATLLGLPFTQTPSAGKPLRIAQLGSYIDRKGIRFGTPALIDAMSRHTYVEVSFFGTGCSVEKVHDDFPAALRSRVHVVQNYRHQELASLLRDHHIMFFPSLFEGFPLVVMEAMACGLAPIITAIPWVAKRLSDRQDALIVPPEDADALGVALTSLITQPDLLENLRSRAWVRAQNFAWARVAADTVLVYRAGIKGQQLKA